MEKKFTLSLLLDFYGDLLTEKQREVIDFYYNEDLSLSEIGEFEGITRQGVRDIIVRAERTLEDIEEKTGLIQRHHRTRASARNLLDLCEKVELLNKTKLESKELSRLCEQLRDGIDELGRD